MAQLNKKIIAVAVAVVFCVLASFWPQERGGEPLQVQQAGQAAEHEKAKITVYVSGAVAKPGLHEIAPGSRAVDAIEAAGGMTEEANRDKVNLAKICKDGMQVNVPRLSAKELRRLQGAQSAAYSGGSVQSDAGNNFMQNRSTETARNNTETAMQGGKVKLNSATAAELEELPGVGAVTAQRIVEYRSAHGFSRVEDLMNVKGIGQAKFNKMLPYLDL